MPGNFAERGLTTLVSNDARELLMLKHLSSTLSWPMQGSWASSSFQYGSPADIDVLMTDESASISQVAALSRWRS